MRRRSKLAIAAGLLVLAGGAAIFAANHHIVAAADGAIYTSLDAVPPHSYAIVLGAVVRPGGIPSEALADRLDVARELYAAHKVTDIYVSGNGGEDEDGVMARWLVGGGVPAEHIIRDGRGFRTRATMENARAIGIHDAIICTQRFHLPRSIVWAREVGIDAVGLEATYRRYSPHFRDDLRETGARTIAMLELLVH
jgi:vancomycin permeability regulator SanA